MRQYDFGAGGLVIEVYIEQHYLYSLPYLRKHAAERRAWQQTWHKTFGKG